MTHDELLHKAARILAGGSYFDAMHTITDVRDKGAEYRPDIVFITGTLRMAECEVKVSVSDFHANEKKREHGIKADERWIICPAHVVDVPPAGWGLMWHYEPSGDFSVRAIPAETCLDDQTLKGRLTHDRAAWMFVREMRKRKSDAPRGERAAQHDELVKAAEHELTLMQCELDFTQLVFGMSVHLDRDFTPAEKRDIRKRIKNHELGRVREVGKTGTFTLADTKGAAVS